jgi:hypothetical protein
VNVQKAQCVVQSWLLSWGIPYEVGQNGLVVDGRLVSFGPGGDVEVDVDAVLSKKFDESMVEVKRLMAGLGRETPELLRNPPTRRVGKDDLLARSMRLTAFAKTPNPPEELLKKYLPIVKREADRAWRRFSVLNQTLLLEPGDYLCIGMVFLTMYLHRYQDLQYETRNRADLTLYLQQEFNHWDKVMHRDLPSLAIDPRGMLVEQFMQAPVPGAQVEWWNTWGDQPSHQRGTHAVGLREPSYTMPEYFEPPPPEPEVFQEEGLPHHQLRTLLSKKDFSAHAKKCPSCAAETAEAKAAQERTVNAKNSLVTRLEALSHSELVESLSMVMNNPFCDTDARDLATNIFRKHMNVCPCCAAAWTAWDEEFVKRRKYSTKKVSVELRA